METIRAAIYRRVSSAKQKEGTSLETQGERCRAYCATEGFAIVMDEQDVHTGGDLHERKGLSRIREAIRAGSIDVMVVYDVDRLTRKQTHLGVLLDEADRHGVGIHAVLEPVDQTPMGQAIMALRAFAGELEREKIRERTMRGKQKRLDDGRLPTWTCDLYGYRMDRAKGGTSRREIVEHEAEIVRFIYQEVCRGRSMHSICEELIERNIPSPGVSRMRYRDGRTPSWHSASMTQLLRNPAYKGKSIANRLTRVRFRNPETGRINTKRQIVRPEEEWTYLPDELTPAIVSEDVWAIANQRLEANKGEFGKNQRRPYLLRGLVRCGRCGGLLYAEVESGKNQRRTYRCGNGKRGKCDGRFRVFANEFEQWVWNEVLHILRNRDAVVRELQRRLGGGGDLSLAASQQSLWRQIEQINDQQGRLLRRYSESSDNSVPWSIIEREIKKLEQEKSSLQSKHDELQDKLDAEEHQILKTRSIVETIDRLASADLDDVSFDEQVRIVRDLGIDLTVNWRLWALNWSVPVGRIVEKDFAAMIDLSGVDATQPSDGGVRSGVHAVVIANRAKSVAHKFSERN